MRKNVKMRQMIFITIIIRGSINISFLIVCFASLLSDYNLCLRVRKKSKETKETKGRKGEKEGGRQG